MSSLGRRAAERADRRAINGRLAGGRRAGPRCPKTAGVTARLWADPGTPPAEVLVARPRGAILCMSGTLQRSKGGQRSASIAREARAGGGEKGSGQQRPAAGRAGTAGCDPGPIVLVLVPPASRSSVLPGARPGGPARTHPLSLSVAPARVPTSKPRPQRAGPTPSACAADERSGHGPSCR
eukprot:scaffold4595_cov415-Prasinococcus_capsulatus_cf.AAC.13